MPTSTARWWPKLSACNMVILTWCIPVVDANAPISLCTTGTHSSLPQCGIAEEFLNDDTVTPHSVNLAMAMIHADHPEAYPLMQHQACRILREDPGHELPEPQVCVEVAETFEG